MATIYALSSGHPPAALAIVRLSGERAFAAVAELTRRPLPAARRAVRRAFYDPHGDELLDEGLLLIFPGPNSATGEDLAELHLHGGRAVVAAVLAALATCDGLRLAEPGEFTRRALTNGRLDLTEAEGLADLLTAETEAQRRAAQALAGGALRRRIDDWRDRLLALGARAEVAIDYVDEEDGAAPPDDLGQDAARLADEIRALLRAPAAERLRDGIRVAVGGPPNAGKSSLINALVEDERAIVSAEAGTTRDLVETPLALAGVPFVLIDTAGLRETGDQVEAIGIARAEQAIATADLLLWLGAPDQRPAREGMLQIAAKADLGGIGEGLATSARDGTGLEAVKSWLIDMASRWMPQADPLALHARQRALLTEIADQLGAVAGGCDPLIAAEHLRAARALLDQLSGRADTEAMLDVLFARFCVGK